MSTDFKPGETVWGARYNPYGDKKWTITEYEIESVTKAMLRLKGYSKLVRQDTMGVVPVFGLTFARTKDQAINAVMQYEERKLESAEAQVTRHVETINAMRAARSKELL